MDTPRAYYFGYRKHAGHELQHTNGRAVRPEDGVPFDPFDRDFWLDGAYAPKRAAWARFGMEAGRVFFVMQGASEDDRRALRHHGDELPQGEFLLHRIRGHTLMAWWDRTQGDARGACNSVFIVEGDHTSEEMLALWPQRFPLQAANLERAGVKLIEVRR